MSDRDATLQSVTDAVIAFRDKRDWAQFHDPKNAAEGLIIEAGELLEQFLWKDKERIAELLSTDREFREEVSDELADVLCWVLTLAHEMKIDLSTALADKLVKTARKYPVEKSKGRAVKYTKL